MADYLTAREGRLPTFSKFSLRVMLLLFGLVPLLAASITMTSFSAVNVGNSVHGDLEDKLYSANLQLNSYMSDQYGEFGEEYFTADDKDYTYVDDFAANTGIYMTIFLGDTRAMTSITDSSGARIEGTAASDAVIAAVLEGGEHFTSDDVDINGERFMVDYLPLYDDAGNIIGMSFTGEKYSAVSAATRSSIIGLIVIAVIQAVVFFIIIILVARIVRKPFTDIGQSLHDMAQGEINKPITARSGVTENQQMIASLDYLQFNLSKIVGDVRGNADSLSGGVVEVEQLSGDSSDSAGQISQAVEDLANGAQSMAENVQNLNMEVLDMGDKVDEINENLGHLVDNAHAMETVNSDAKESMNGVLNSSNQTTEAVNSIHDQIIVTNDSITKINEAIDLIISIASQTKLLSLNASIEAARAGEAGKGFAVVADSISDLSEQSNESANTIRAIAEEILTNSNESVQLAGRIKEVIEGEKEAVRTTQEKFDELQEAIDKSIEGIRSIETTTDALNNIKQELTSNVTDLSAISEENAASNEEVAASVTSIVTSVDEIANKMKDMNDMSDSLENAVDYFK